MTSNPTSSWRCQVCGYVHPGETPPDGCPVCGAARTDFEAAEPMPPATPEPVRQWRCLVCNYVHNGEAPPESCPVCGAHSDQFEPEDGSFVVVDREQDGRLHHFVFHDGRMVGCILLGDASAGAAAKHAVENRIDFSTLLAGRPSVDAVLGQLGR